MPLRARVPTLLALAALASSCKGGPPGTAPVASVELDARARDAQELRAKLVERLAQDGHLQTPRVREAFTRTPRHEFLPPGASLEAAYENRPQPIGEGQTISQPAVVAIMTEALELSGTERVLEIGTGSGYQAAILSGLCREVLTIELVPSLGARAARVLQRLGYANVEVRVGDGYAGWPDRAPFDRVIVTAAPEEVPAALIAQLAEGGILVAPVGSQDEPQRLVVLRKRGGKVEREERGLVRFVPMVRPTR